MEKVSQSALSLTNNRGSLTYFISPLKERVPSPIIPQREKRTLYRDFLKIREETTALCQSMEEEDFSLVLKGKPKPIKWYLGHTTWFFEYYVLQRFLKGYHELNEAYEHFFSNHKMATSIDDVELDFESFSRPTIRDVLSYRTHVDEAMMELLHKIPAADQSEVEFLVQLGMNIEAEVQELILSDIKYAFFSNRLKPVYARDDSLNENGPTAALQEGRWIEIEGGLHNVGFGEEGFAFDDEMPRHTAYIHPFAVSQRLVTNGEFLEFIEDDGYKRKDLWLPEGWRLRQQHNREAPFYWIRRGGTFDVYTLCGIKRLDINEPVAHLSYFEADAFARWADARLLTEFEWEVATSQMGSQEGNFLETGRLRPRALRGIDIRKNPQVMQLQGDVWEWTSSPFVPYPGYTKLEFGHGHLKGRFLSNRIVLRGGSCLTNQRYFRNTYRKSVSLVDVTLCSGIRLAKEL